MPLLCYAFECNRLEIAEVHEVNVNLTLHYLHPPLYRGMFRTVNLAGLTRLFANSRGPKHPTALELRTAEFPLETREVDSHSLRVRFYPDPARLVLPKLSAALSSAACLRFNF